MKEIITSCTPIVAIGAISLIEYHAMNHGIDGTLLTITIAIIAGIAGYHVPALKKLISSSSKADPGEKADPQNKE